MSSSQVKITKERIVESSSGSKGGGMSGAWDVDTGSTYSPSMSSRSHSSVVRSSGTGGGFGGGGSGGSSYTRRVVTSSYGSAGGTNASAYGNMAHAGAVALSTTRDREKKDMQDLNERFANYIEKVRFLEAQNKKLAAELDNLKTKWGKETEQIKIMYEAELKQARDLLDGAEKDKARLELQLKSMEEKVADLQRICNELKKLHNADRETIDRQNQQLSDYEAEINLLRRRVNTYETDHQRDKAEIERLTNELTRTKIDLDNETLNRISAENQVQSLEEEIEFLKSLHEQEMKELANLAYRDTTAENREYWKNELSSALREIQQVYDDKLGQIRNEMETFYNVKVQEYKTGSARQNLESVHVKEENTRIKKQITDLRQKVADLENLNMGLDRNLQQLMADMEEKQREWDAERNEMNTEIMSLRQHLEQAIAELQTVLDNKLSLELEIAAYRKLLEGEESRIGLRNAVESVMSSESMSMSGGGGGGGGGMSGAYGSGGSSSGYSASYSSRSGMEQSANAKQSVTSQHTIVLDEASSVMRGEVQAKTTFQRSAKGNISIAETDVNAGKYITLENTGRKDEGIGGWQIRRRVTDAKGISKEYSYTFPSDFNLAGRRQVKIGARGFPGCDLTYEHGDSWGTGMNVTTQMFDASGNEKATHVQKTSYQS